MTPVLLSWSGGKDSALALNELQRRDEVEVVALVTTFTRGYDRVSMHGVRRELIQQQAEALKLPVVEIWISQQATNAEYEAAFAEGVSSWIASGVSTIAFGDLFLEDIRQYRERLCRRIGATPLFPIWGRNTRDLAESFIADGFRAKLCCVDSRAIPKSLCGREFDAALLQDLPTSADPCGENGEFHTFVYDGPVFESSVPVATGIERQDGPFVFCDLKPMLTPEEICR